MHSKPCKFDTSLTRGPNEAKRKPPPRWPLDDLGPQDVVHVDDAARTLALVDDDQARDRSLHHFQRLRRGSVGSARSRGAAGGVTGTQLLGRPGATIQAEEE